VSKVAELVDQDRGWWNEALIDRTFDARSAAIVKQVPLQNVLGKDLVWWWPVSYWDLHSPIGLWCGFKIGF
jgi:hypothetical protein